MIQLSGDCFVLETSDGTLVPCSPEAVVDAVLSQAEEGLDPQVVGQATLAILHYFRQECGRTQVSVGDLAGALAKVLQGFGLEAAAAADSSGRGALTGVEDADLRCLACESGKGFELLFFSRLRAELRQRLARAPSLVCFHGLRGCVKQLTGARRWSWRCQRLSDQIVDFLRGCLGREPARGSCALVVR